MKFPINAFDYHSGIFTGLNPASIPSDTAQNVFAWLMDNARNGSDEAQANLGVMYAKGIGVPENPMEAAHWFQRAADNDNGLALYNLGIAREDRRVSGLLWMDSRHCYERSATAGYPWAALKLAQIDIDSASPHTMKTAYMTFKGLMTQGGLQGLEVQRAAQFWRAACQLFGRGVRTQRKAGMANMLQAALLGHLPALHFLYDYHFKRGPGFPTELRWGIASSARLYPPYPDSCSIYILWHLLPDRRHAAEQYLLQNISRYEAEFADREYQAARDMLNQAEAVVQASRLTASLWAKESGIMELYHQPATPHHPD